MTTVINLSVSTVAMVLGLFVVTSPARAAKIWGSERFERLAPQNRTSFLRWWRVFGILLCLGGVLFAIDSIGYLDYSH